MHIGQSTPSLGSHKENSPRGKNDCNQQPPPVGPGPPVEPFRPAPSLLTPGSSSVNACATWTRAAPASAF